MNVFVNACKNPYYPAYYSMKTEIWSNFTACGELKDLNSIFFGEFNMNAPQKFCKMLKDFQHHTMQTDHASAM